MLISVADKRTSKTWRPKEYTWDEFAEALSKFIYTKETLTEYAKLSKTQRDDIKDVGGFVGGYIKGGRRTKDSIKDRCLITLDADYLIDIESLKEKLKPYECVMYSTHSHTDLKPRVRLVFPLDTPQTPDAYEAIARKIAEKLNIEIFDPTTFEPTRLMYWPSCSSDAKPIYEHFKGAWIDTEKILNEYRDWTDTMLWAYSTKSKAIIKNEVKKQGDPLAKSGMIGYFCRTYTIHEAIEKFLSDLYTPCEDDNRYTYIGGTTVGGLVIYNDLFAYSHHATDPTSGILCNAYDLVRLHLYPEDKDGMRSLIFKDERVQHTINMEMVDAYDDDLLEDEKEEIVDVLSKLAKNNKGVIVDSTENYEKILNLDPKLKGCLGYDEFSLNVTVLRDLPWRSKDLSNVWTNSDDSELRTYIEKYYSIYNKQKLVDAFTVCSRKHRFHPLRDYFNKLLWDGVPRIETLFIDYLGVKDTVLNRTMSKKWLIAAVKRVFEPGCKFDNVIVLVGSQGIGKTFLLTKLGMQWFNNSLPDINSKDALQSLHGSFIIELGELAATKKSDNETIKAFLSKIEDKFRAPYDRLPEKHKRQCIFAGTTNDYLFLKDRTGNRRFWPLECSKGKKSIFTDLTADEIDQIWAEAVEKYENGEGIFLTEYETEELEKVQKAHTEGQDTIGQIEYYLDMYVPHNWRDMDIFERRLYIKTYDGSTKDRYLRNEICVLEILCELFEYDRNKITSATAREFNSIMQNLEGWGLYAINRGRKNFKMYGKQRAYVRNELSIYG